MRAQRVQTEKWGRELDAARNRLATAEADARECAASCSSQVAENAAQQGALRAAHEEAGRLQQDLMRQHKLKDAQVPRPTRESQQAQATGVRPQPRRRLWQAKSLKVAEDAHCDVKKQVEALRSQTGTLERELKLEAREAQLDQQTMADLAAELEELKKMLGTSAHSTQRQARRFAQPQQPPHACMRCGAPNLQVDIIKLNTTMIKSLEANIFGFKQESTKQRKVIYHLEKEREKSGAEASDASAKFAAYQSSYPSEQRKSARLKMSSTRNALCAF